MNIVIPAYNESFTLVRTLEYLLSDGYLHHCHIVIVCNGCTDNTYELAKSYKSENHQVLTDKNIELTVVNIEEGSKTKALNKGVEELEPATTVLLDADILVTGETVTQLSAFLVDNELLASAPKVYFNYQGSDTLTKCYYTVAEQTAYNQINRLSNVIALSIEAQKAIFPMPAIIADDEYIRRKITPEQLKIFLNKEFEFKCPKHIASLFRTLTRVYRGNVQLEKLGLFAPKLARTTHQSRASWCDKLFFLSLTVAAKMIARIQWQLGMIHQWEQDETTRVSK